MDREKLNMELTSKAKTLYTTFQKRKKGLIKKAQEFSILCDVDACMIIYGPKIDGRPVEPEIWPNDLHKVRSIINNYHEKSKEGRLKRATDSSAFFETRKKRIEEEISRLKGHNAEAIKRATNSSAFFETRKKRIEEEISGLRRQNTEAKYPPWDNRISNFSYDELNRLSSGLKNKIQEVMKLIEMKRNQCLVETGRTPLPLTEASHSLTQSNQNLSIYLNRQQQHQPQPQQLPSIGINPFYQQDMSFASNPMMLNWTGMVGNDGDFPPYGVASSGSTHPPYNPRRASYGNYNQGPTLMDSGNSPQNFYYPPPSMAMPVSVLKPPPSFSSQLNGSPSPIDENFD
ncbi:Transcription factor, MADS-box [Dillenia turbinata]|uniref:Transcription factor, MADS-box n=1 Tax=Dillenia turbinata TaxID=194707 RepID=A0AAN8WD02_9MAGN